MIVGHVVTADASEYERKCQRVDAAHFEVDLGRADVVHVYTGKTLPPIEKPFVANIDSTRRRFSFRRESKPAVVVTPFNVQEAVEERYFATSVILSREDGEGPPSQERRGSFAALRPSGAPSAQDDRSKLGSFARPSVQSLIERTMHRIDRFRDDVEWLLFSRVPAPEEIAELGAWVDPAVEENDYDGFVAEALAVGINVVATATPINMLRLEKGRTGFLVPRNDPNEMTHAILAGLFKPEEARARSDAARQTVGKFRAGQRIRTLTRIYESIVHTRR
ncbi:MAG TPA: glycosyltransferase [Thermoanaerobaculia bacterium]|nr:glycosyltransferase [Thermoanaerobaculia bacterium]